MSPNLMSPVDTKQVLCLRDGSFHLNVFYKNVEFYGWEMNIKRNI